MAQPLDILSIGAGAIGTYIGGSLALHGHRVVFLERPQISDELRQRHLRLNMRGVEHIVSEPAIASSIDEALMLGPYDVALFALKSYDSADALQSYLPYAQQLPPFLCLSNGVENEGLIAKTLGQGKVIYGTVTTAVGRRNAGDILLEKSRGVGIASGHPLSSRLVAALDDAGLNCKQYTNGLEMKWSKMLTNLIANATSAILDMTPAQIFAHPGLYWLEMSMLRECLSVMQAQGLQVVNLPGTPVKLLAFAARWLPLWLSRPLLASQVGGGRGDKMPSFHIDLHSGRGQSEVGYLNGAIVRKGEVLGIPTPANHMLEQVLTALTLGHQPLDEYRHKPEKLLAEY